MQMNDKEFQEAQTELEEITADFCENYSLNGEEFNGLMLAQIVKWYTGAGEYDYIRDILNNVLKSIDDLEADDPYNDLQ